jgi:hypothetical protein
MTEQNSTQFTRYTSTELLTKEWPIEYMTYPKGRSHWFDGERMACGLNQEEKPNFKIENSPTRPLCRRCMIAKEWRYELERNS